MDNALSQSVISVIYEQSDPIISRGIVLNSLNGINVTDADQEVDIQTAKRLVA